MNPLLLCAWPFRSPPASSSPTSNMMPSFLTPLRPFPRLSPPPRLTHPRRPRWRAVSDWYKILNVPTDADSTTIKRAYRRAALQNHPDVSKAPDAKERFLQIQEAYSVLSDKSKRAAYDRQSQRPRNVGVGVDDVWNGSAGDTFDARARDFARQWREKNPMPEDLDDSLGSIFSDLFEGVKGVVGEGGVMEDFVDFLERGVGGLGVGQDALGDVLRSSDVEVLEAEIEDASFVLEQLRRRRERLQEDAKSVIARAQDWGKRADRPGTDYMTKDAARERERELTMEGKRLDTRAKKTAALIDKEEDRLRKLRQRLEQVQRDKQKAQSARNANPARDSKERVKSRKTDKEAIDEELERMKRELGL